ncbi:MAG: hypothetical protein U0X20_02045 [Caldilineaceae bacterium]
MIDRAYVDGKTLYELDQLGIRFGRACQAQDGGLYITALAKSVESPLVYERLETVTHSRGRNRTVETLLTCRDCRRAFAPGRAIRPPTQPGKHLRHRQRPALNAVLVRIWRNHEQQEGATHLSDQWRRRRSLGRHRSL